MCYIFVCLFSCVLYSLIRWRGGRVVECVVFEKWSICKGIVGLNFIFFVKKEVFCFVQQVGFFFVDFVLQVSGVVIVQLMIWFVWIFEMIFWQEIVLDGICYVLLEGVWEVGIFIYVFFLFVGFWDEVYWYSIDVWVFVMQGELCFGYGDCFDKEVVIFYFVGSVLLVFVEYCYYDGVEVDILILGVVSGFWFMCYVNLVNQGLVGMV